MKSLGADVQSSSGVYVKGKISRIDEGNNFAASGTYGNATFYISDDGATTSDQFYCYRVLYLGNKKWTSKDPDVKVGDDVIIYGHVVNYKGNTPETVQGTAFVYEHNGVNRGTDEGGGGGTEGTPAGTGTVDDPYNVAAARAAVKDLTWTSNTEYEKTGTVYVKGKISRIADNGTFGQSGTFGNATFYINDDGADGAELYAYRILYLGNKKYTSGTDIKVGDEVVICGELMNYRGNTPETVSNAAYLYSLNGEGGGGDTPPGPGGDPAGTGTATDPYNVAAARNAVKDFTWTSNTEYDKTGTVYVKGKISKIADNGTFGQSGTFGNATFYISDDGKEGNELYCYRILYLGNVKYTSGTDIKVGDEVVICGELMNYRGNTPETVANAAYLHSLNESGGGGGGGDTPGGASGSGTLADPYNPLGAINAVKGLTWTSNTEYESTGEVYVKGKISRIASGGTYTEGGTFGNASFYISEDGAEKDEFYCFRILYLGNKKFEAGQTDIKVGDEVVVYGKLMNYRNNTPETVSGSAYLYSLNDGGSGGGGDTPGGNGSGTLADPYDAIGAINAVKGLTWTSNTEYEKTDKVYVKGKISRIANNGTYVGGGTFGNASYWISVDGTEKDEFQIYRSLYFNGEKYTEGTDIKVGDEVIVYGALMNYRGNTPETVANENWLFSLNGKTDGSGGGGGDTPGGNGSGTLTDPYTALGAIDAVKDLTWTSNTVYDKTDKVYVKGKISRIANNGTYGQSGTFGNASYWISVDGTEKDEFQIYRSLYFNGEKYTEGTDIKVGDEVVVYGSLMNYKGNTPETVANENWLYSLNGKTDGSGGGGGDTPSGNGSGTLADPYTALGAIDAVKDLTWTSNTVYDKTDKVYVKGKISRIANNGTYVGGGTFGNASYWISADGTEKDEFQIFRSLYFNGEKYTSGTDIQVGDEVIVYGALMNYKGNTPETVANENWLYSLNGKTDGSGGGGGDTPAGSSLTIETNDALSWGEETDGTYGAGFSVTTQGMKLGFYKHAAGLAVPAPNASHIRVYKNAAFSIASAEGKKIKKIVIGCAPNAGNTSYCFDMAGLEGGASATCDKSALTVTWTGSASKVVLQANNGQVRVEKITVAFE